MSSMCLCSCIRTFAMFLSDYNFQPPIARNPLFSTWAAFWSLCSTLSTFHNFPQLFVVIYNFVTILSSINTTFCLLFTTLPNITIFCNNFIHILQVFTKYYVCHFSMILYVPFLRQPITYFKPTLLTLIHQHSDWAVGCCHVTSLNTLACLSVHIGNTNARIKKNTITKLGRMKINRTKQSSCWQESHA